MRIMKIAAISLILGFCFSIGHVDAQNISDDARRYFSRGMAAVETAKSTADYKDAAKEFERAKILAPDWPDVYYNLGMILEKTGDYETAVNNLKTYLQIVPSASDANQIQEKIYKMEYKMERSNIEGIWQVDKNEMDVISHPRNYKIIAGGGMRSSDSAAGDIILEFKKEFNEYKVRILSSKGDMGSILSLPDGPYVGIKREGDMIKIFDAKLYLCRKDCMSNNCQCKADFILEQVSANTLKGTVKIYGIVKEIVNYRTSRAETVQLTCEGKIVLIK